MITNNRNIKDYSYIIVKDKLELNFKDSANYLNILVKGVMKITINDDTNNIIILRNNERLEIKDLLVHKVTFTKDHENCIFAKAKLCVMNNSGCLNN